MRVVLRRSGWKWPAIDLRAPLRALRRRGRPDRVERLLALQSEAQRLRLEVAARDELVHRLRADLGRERAQAQEHLAAALQADRERLLAAVATPVTQLLTQAYLLEQGERPVQARDVVAVGRRLVRALEDEGLRLVGRVGEQATFDPAQHELLSSSRQPAAGEPVVARFVGVAYRGRLLRRAGVEVIKR